MTDLRAAAETAVEQCLGLEAGESCVVVTDDERLPIGEALYDVASDITDATLLRYPPGEQHGEEPPSPVAAAMKDADVFLAPTTKSLSHTRARGAANDAGARGATLPGITEDVFTTGLDADYETIAKHCEDVLAQVEGADELRVTTPAGRFEKSPGSWTMPVSSRHSRSPGSNVMSVPAGVVTRSSSAPATCASTSSQCWAMVS